MSDEETQIVTGETCESNQALKKLLDPEFLKNCIRMKDHAVAIGKMMERFDPDFSDEEIERFWEDVKEPVLGLITDTLTLAVKIGPAVAVEIEKASRDNGSMFKGMKKVFGQMSKIFKLVELASEFQRLIAKQGGSGLFESAD